MTESFNKDGTTSMGNLNNTESVLSQIYNKQERSDLDMFEPNFSNGRFYYYSLFIMDIYSLKIHRNTTKR